MLAKANMVMESGGGEITLMIEQMALKLAPQIDFHAKPADNQA